jgi:hypothetical protein
MNSEDSVYLAAFSSGYQTRDQISRLLLALICFDLVNSVDLVDQCWNKESPTAGLRLT